MLIAMSCVMLIENRIVGLVMLTVSAVFSVVLCLLRINEFKHLKNSVVLINESLSDLNKDRICTVPLPFAVCSSDGRIIWYNDSFASCAAGHDDFSEDMFSGIISDFELDNTNYTKPIEIFGRKYTSFISCVNTDNDSVYQIYLIDDTYYKDIESEYNSSRPVVIMISIDAADEASVILSHSLYTSFISDIEKKITEWFSDKSCITRKIGDNRFIAVTEYMNLLKMIESRFDIMDMVRNYKINDKTSGFTLSIGVGTGGLATECEQFSRQALDMARGRGGDQTAIKNGENYQFFGGVSDGVEKRGQIRSRLIAKAIEDAIKKASEVIIMGHTASDLDALGSAVGLACAVRNLDTDVHIAVDALEHVHHGRHDVARRAADNRQVAVLVHGRADARVYPDGAYVGAPAAVAVDEVDGALTAVKQRVKVAVHIRLLAEHTAEVVACAGGEGADRNVRKLRRAAHALVEGAVAAAGVHAQMLAGGGLRADLGRRVHRGARDVYLKLPAALGKRGLHLCPDGIRRVAPAGRGIDDKNMLHISAPYCSSVI